MSTHSRNEAADVARWMLQEFIRNDCRLGQREAFNYIRAQFGEEFLDKSRQRDSIAKSVLQEFQKLTGETVVWDMNEGGWRRRVSKDPPGTRHAYE